MKNMILAAIAALSLGMSAAAFAQGLPPGVGDQQYGASWAANHAKR
jgi:hypothetical protein